jgi:hypothetical protein
MLNSKLGFLLLTCGFLLASCGTGKTAPLVVLSGSDFSGGGGGQFGSSFYGRDGVNMVYARPSGKAAVMTAYIKLTQLPDKPVSLVLEGMDDDAPAQCQIRIALNGRELSAGASHFSDGHWQIRRFPIPVGALKTETNELSINNLEPAGNAGSPPWFMVARAAIADGGYQLPVVEPPELHLKLPNEIQPFPKPLPVTKAQPGFKLRGTKGWAWTPEQYLEEIPFLVRYKMNFLMNCYTSMFTSPSNHIGGWTNEWWKPLPEWKKEAYAGVIRECRKNDITFCFAIHPQIGSSRPLDPNKTQDIDDLYQHFDWAQGRGVHWFSISLDDVSWTVNGPAACGADHAGLVNTVLNRLRRKDPQAQLIFCPGPYSGDGTNPNDHAYLQSLGRALDAQVYIFWTGNGVVDKSITRKAAESYKSVVQHRLFFWDNYPVNDGNPTMHLGPVNGRAADLCEVMDGYMSNPMAEQNEINRIPLATCADYAYNPWEYDPARSIGQAILTLAKTLPQQQALKDLVETYPGFLVSGGNPGTNPARGEFETLLRANGSRAGAEKLVRRLEDISARLRQEFPGEFNAARRTVDNDVAWMKAKL